MVALIPRLGWKRARHGVAFGTEFLLAARMRSSRRDGGLIETSRRDYPSGLVSVSPAEPNIRSVSTLARLAGEALEEVQFTGGKVAAVLPDLAIRCFVLPREYRGAPSKMLSQLAPRLPYPSDEALMDAWQAPAGWILAAAVRRVVLGQYEQALEAIGCRAAWVDGASLVHIPGWARGALREAGDGPGGLRVHVQLYLRHYTVVVFDRAELLDVRVKLRAPGDADVVAEELRRLPSLYDGGDCREISIRGEGGGVLATMLEMSGGDRGEPVLYEDGEEDHLQCLLTTLMLRAR
jgi:hypothetical protein